MTRRSPAPWDATSPAGAGIAPRSGSPATGIERGDADDGYSGPAAPVQPILEMPAPTAGEASADRAGLVARWLVLTREILPALAAASGGAIRADHCFQRILLDAAFGGCWYDHVAGRPAHARADAAALARAVAIGEDVAAGRADLCWLNARSLAWRAARRRTTPVRSSAGQHPAGAGRDLFGIGDLAGTDRIVPAPCGTVRDARPFKAPQFRQE